jgi:photosystem II stability/assembly factor-like uncharacterized protein
MRKPVTALLLTAVLAFAAAPSLRAARWTQTSLFGGDLLVLAQAPSSPQTLYGATRFNGLFLSEDGGATWQPRGVLPTDLNLVSGLAVSPHDAQTVYALATGRILHSHDAGLHWSFSSEDLPGVLAFALDPEQPDVLYAGTDAGLYRSTDGGDQWSLFGGFYTVPTPLVAIDPLEGALYVATRTPDGYGEPLNVSRSPDRGTTWETVGPLPVPANFDFFTPHFAFDPSLPGTIYSFFESEDGYYDYLSTVALSSDGGASWTELPSAVGVRDLTVAPDGAVFVATRAGVSRSNDHGATWSPELPAQEHPSPKDVVSQVLAPAPGVVLAAGASGFWKSTNGGAAWELSNQGLTALWVYDLLVSPVGPRFVFGLAAGGNLYRSADRGAHWARIYTPLDGPGPFRLQAFDPRDGRTVYGIGGDGMADTIVKSTNGGRTWSELPFPYRCDSGGSLCSVTINTITLDPTDPDTIFAIGNYFLHYGGHGNFLVRSSDGGATWTNLDPRPEIGTLVIDPRRPETIYAASCRGKLYKSEDGGQRWRRVGSGLPDNLCGMQGGAPQVVIDPRDSRRLYVSTGQRGVFTSSNGGANFRVMNRGIESAPVSMLLIDPQDPDRLYVGSPGKGVFAWQAQRKRWTPLNEGLPVLGYDGELALEPRSPEALYAPAAFQVFRLDLEAD